MKTILIIGAGKNDLRKFNITPDNRYVTMDMIPGAHPDIVADVNNMDYSTFSQYDEIYFDFSVLHFIYMESLLEIIKNMHPNADIYVLLEEPRIIYAGNDSDWNHNFIGVVELDEMFLKNPVLREHRIKHATNKSIDAIYMALSSLPCEFDLKEYMGEIPPIYKLKIPILGYLKITRL